MPEMLLQRTIQHRSRGAQTPAVKPSGGSNPNIIFVVSDDVDCGDAGAIWVVKPRGILRAGATASDGRNRLGQRLAGGAPDDARLVECRILRIEFVF